MKRLLVLGGQGQLGQELCRLAREDWEVAAPSRFELDITKADQLAPMLARLQPSAVVNCAAFHDLAKCEADEALARDVNERAVANLALACKGLSARLLTLSTDYVFSGEAKEPYGEDAPTSPLQAYGRSKAAGERAALAVWPEGVLVVRSCGLYGKGGSRVKGSNFVEKRLADAARAKHLEVGDDLVCTPTATAHLAPALLGLLALPGAAGGIYHLAAEGQCSWAEFTQAIFDLAQIDCRVVPVDRKGDYGAIRRPAYSVLANRKAASLGVRLADWRQGLADYLSYPKNVP